MPVDKNQYPTLAELLEEAPKKSKYFIVYDRHFRLPVKVTTKRPEYSRMTQSLMVKELTADEASELKYLAQGNRVKIARNTSG